MIKVSVIIPVYNTEKFLPQCLDSVIGQTLKEIEIICINDGSTDNSLSVLENYAQKDHRIKIINKINEGVSIARNIGIHISKGKYISFIDSDDYIEKNTLELSFNKLEEDNSDIVIFGTNNININNQKEDNKNNTILLNIKSTSNISNNLNAIIHLQHNIWDKMYRKSFLQEKQISFPLNIAIGEDGVFSLICYINSAKYSIIPISLYNYRIGRNGSATTNNINAIQQQFEAFKSIENYKLFRQQNENTQKIIINKFLDGCLYLLKNSPKQNIKTHITHIKLFTKYLIKTYGYSKIKKLESYKKINNKISPIRIFLRKIFHLENSKDKKEKILTFCFFKIKFKRNNTTKYFNNIKKNSVLLFEAQPHHGECLPAYIKYLNDLGFHVDILMLKKLIKTKPFCRMPRNSRFRIFKYNYSNIDEILKNKNILHYKHIIITTAIHNYTPQISVIEQYPTLKKHPSIYIIEHDIKDISKNKEENYLISNRIITLWNFHKGIMINPHYFGKTKITAKSRKSTFIVVGNIEAKRKNHKILFDSIEALHKKNKNFNVIIIGRNKDNNYKIKDNIKEHLTITGYLNFPKMFKYMEKADFFIPLLDNNNQDHNRYLESGVSGSIQLILGFKKIPIIQQKFADFYGFNSSNGIIYTENLTNAMEKALELNQTNYSQKQFNLKKYAESIYKISISNLDNILKNALSTKE